MRLVNDVVVHWECQYEQERREKVSFLFFFFNSFYISVAVPCYLSIPSISFLASRVSFSLHQTDLVIWTVIVVV